MSLAASWCGTLSHGGERVQSRKVLDELRLADGQNGEFTRVPGQRLLFTLLARGNVFLGYPAFTFRQSTLRRRGGVETRLRIASDYDTLCWLSLQGDAAVFSEVGYLRREHAQNMTRDRVAMFLDILKVRARYVKHSRVLRADMAAADALRGECYSFAYWTKQSGHYRTALQAILLNIRMWGFTRHNLLALAKWLPHWAYTQLSGRSLVQTSYSSR
jgi:hypothetical protein